MNQSVKKLIWQPGSLNADASFLTAAVAVAKRKSNATGLLLQGAVILQRERRRVHVQYPSTALSPCGCFVMPEC
jgi:hypothetical protein